MSTMPLTSALPDRLFHTGDIARLTDTRPVTIREWVKQGKFPKPIKICRRFYLCPEQIRNLIGASDERGAA
jgi:hypothetical protein